MSLSNINNGLVFAGSSNLPQWPDNVAGTTYFQDVFATTDSWVGAGLAASVSGGSLILTSASTGTELVTRTASQIASNTVKLRVRLVQGTITSITLGSNLGLTSQTFVPTTQFQIFNLTPVVNWSGTLSAVTLNLNGQSANCIIQIDWIYIGDGTYSSRLLDASGNGNHGTVFGATPTADGALSFDGVNDRIRLTNTPDTIIRDNISISFWMRKKRNFSNITNTFERIIHTQGTDNVSVFNNTSALFLKINGVELNSGARPSIPDSAIPLNTLTHILAVRNGTVMQLYLNGILYSSVTCNSAQIPASTGIYQIGETTTANGAPLIDISAPRIYNRALTEAEITALATAPDAYNLDRVVRSITPVPGSVMTRDINGDTQVRRLESTIATGTAPLTVASTTLVTNLNADRVDGLEGSDFVRGTGTVSQTITGVKTFSSIPVLPASDPTTVNQATRKAYIDGKLPGKITISASAPTGGTDGDIWITV